MFLESIAYLQSSLTKVLSWLVTLPQVFNSHYSP